MLDVALAQVDALARVQLFRRRVGCVGAGRIGLLPGGGGGAVVVVEGLVDGGGIRGQRLAGGGGAAYPKAGVLEVVQDLRLGGPGEYGLAAGVVYTCSEKYRILIYRYLLS